MINPEELTPIKRKCLHCGEIYEEGLVRAKVWPVQEGWLCPKCRSTLKKITITRIIYENGLLEIMGDCTICNQYPCRHGNASGEFDSPVDPVKLPAELRQRWLETLMTFPQAEIFPNIWKFPTSSEQPAHEVTVYWPLGEGGRPAEVYAEIEHVLEVHNCALTTYKTDSDDHLGWIHRVADPAPTEKQVKRMLRRDGEGLERMLGNLIFWDWKESRGEMIKDLNEAMEALKIPLKWKLGEKLNGA